MLSAVYGARRGSRMPRNSNAYSRPTASAALWLVSRVVFFSRRLVDRQRRQRTPNENRCRTLIRATRYCATLQEQKARIRRYAPSEFFEQARSRSEHAERSSSSVMGRALTHGVSIGESIATFRDFSWRRLTHPVSGNTAKSGRNAKPLGIKSPLLYQLS